MGIGYSYIDRYVKICTNLLEVAALSFELGVAMSASSQLVATFSELASGAISATEIDN